MFIDFFLIAGMSFLALLIFFLVRSRVHFSRKLLVIFFANAFFFLLYYYSFLHRSHLIGGVAVLFGHGVGFLLGPTMLFLLKSLLFPRHRIIKPLLRNLIPYFAVFVLVNIPLSIAVATDYLSWFHGYYLAVEPVFNIAENGYFFAYLISTYRFLIRLRGTFEEHYSTLEKNNLQWYKQLVIGFMVIVVADSLCTVYELYFPVIPWNIGTVIAFSLIVMYLYLGYKGMYQSQLLMPDFLLSQLQPEPVVPKEAYTGEEPHEKAAIRQLDSFTATEIEVLKERLLELLDTEKVYLDAELNLSDLSDRLEISNKKLSELLNQHLHTNFYNLINDYRIEEVKKRLDSDDAEKYTVISLAYDSGFQSKASFYRIFKQKVGVSPADYRKKETAAANTLV